MASPTTLAIVSQSGQSLKFFDATTGHELGSVFDLAAEPHELCMNHMTGLLYVSHTYKHGWYTAHGDYVSLITVVDCQTKQVVDTIDISPYLGPHYVQLDAARNILYASIEGGITKEEPEKGGIVGIDLSSRTVVKHIASDYKSHWFVMTPDGSKAYTCNKEAAFISVIDLIGARLIAKVHLPGGCEQPGISADGSLAFFPTPAIGQSGNSPSIKVIETASDTIVHSIHLDTGAVTVHVDPCNRLLVGLYRMEVDKISSKPIPSYGGVALYKPNGSGYERLATFETGLIPLTILAHPDKSKAYASNVLDGTASVLDLDAGVVQKTIEVDVVRRKDKGMHQGAHGLALM